MNTFVEITKQDGTSDRHPIVGQQVTLGRSGTAGISLPHAMNMELEHLLIAPRGKEGCWVAVTQGAKTPTHYKGKPFQSGMLKWNSELRVGELTIKVTNKSTAAKDKKGPSPVLLLAVVAALAFVGYLVIFSDGTDSIPSIEGIEPPELFVENGACPTSGSPQDNAMRLENQAHSRGDRYFYEMRDGVEAVGLYASAAECYRSLGNSEAATRMDARKAEMTARITADYAARRLRMTRSLAEEDYEATRREVNALLSLTSHLDENNDYIQWLKHTRRVVIARAAQAQN